MKRREFLQITQAGIILSAAPSLNALDYFEKKNSEDTIAMIQNEFCADALIDPDLLKPRAGDTIATPQQFALIKSLYRRIYRVQRTVGYGHFNMISFDEMINIGKRYRKVGRFTKDELNLFEEFFYESAQNYGFYGEKVLTDMTHTVNRRDIKKIRYSGHYLFKGDALNKYYKIRKEMGHKVVLTSGVRNIVKQMYLFLNKIVSMKGNISVASRSLAPSGYSYHGISDFDIGKVGFGARNFTADFAKTEEFKKLIRLGYINIRYPKNNPFGVRYEPWHIKVHS